MPPPEARDEPVTVVLDLGGTRLRIGHLQGDAPSENAGGLDVHPTEALRRADDPVDHLADLIGDYARRSALEPDSVVVGVPFTPDPARETALSSPNIRNLEGAPLRRGLAERLGVPIVLERDINLLLLGEWRAGAACGRDAVFGMFVGTGVGGCFLQEGVPFRGSTGAALELGHIPVRAEGRRCVCGNIDCLEAYACGHVLREIADRHDVELARAFVDGPEVSRAAATELDEFVRDLAYALATAVNLFQPELALMGGGIVAMEGFPRERFREVFYAHLRRPVPAETVELAWARLGSRAALHGAAALPAPR